MDPAGSRSYPEKVAGVDFAAAAISPESFHPSRTTPLRAAGVGNTRTQHWNLTKEALIQHALARGEASMAAGGPLVVQTGRHTGRAAKDKYFVDEPSSNKNINWEENQKMSEATFDRLHAKVAAYMEGRDLFVMDLNAGHHPEHRLRTRVVTETAWHAMFAHTMLIRPAAEELAEYAPEFTILHAPGLMADPELDGTRSPTFICLNMAKRLALIGGTFYAGEIKKTVFTLMNYYLPLKGVLTMHSAANVGADGKTAVFFGLSGTGKTTLSADPSRQLIGDDEHGWCEDGVFNIEGGCYAKVIRLSAEAEPTIYSTTRRFGTVMENVVMDRVTREVDLDDDTLTANTRAAYPLSFVDNRREDARGGLPTDIVMLTCDAFGVLPPISRLTPAQAMYWFLLGYTAKVAGTEQGMTAAVEATFSACFGLPFMPLHPSVYGRMLRERLERHGVRVWLLNTGWSGGAYGTGKRFSIRHTRALLSAALDGRLDGVETKTHPVFNLAVPTSCEGVPQEVLDARGTWADPAAYDRQAAELAHLCRDAFEKYKGYVEEDVMTAGPDAA